MAHLSIVFQNWAAAITQQITPVINLGVIQDHTVPRDMAQWVLLVDSSCILFFSLSLCPLLQGKQSAIV